ncbi:MAG TPA: hypothetical protein VKF38_07875 [Anaerolineaceae bacterium]|nr:hypothetical protein [Anaerolineaceae bacterium]
MLNKSRLTLALILIFSFPRISAHPLALPVANVNMVSPSACPSGGCAAGQRVNMQVSFTTSNSNVRVCIYQSWGIDSTSTFAVASSGDNGSNYSVSNCDTTNLSGTPTPNGYTLITGAQTSLQVPYNETLEFSLRIPSGAKKNGFVLVNIEEQDSASNWSITQQVFFNIPVKPASSNAYVANNPGDCGSHSPCYIDSGDDLTDGANGIGTGLKDAIDASIVNSSSNPVVNILGAYLIKDNAVLINQSITLQGTNNSKLTYNGSACDQNSEPMLNVTTKATIQNLTIDDGGCGSPGRDLISINDPNNDPISIQSNDLSGGQNAVTVQSGNQANIIIVFNQITGNNGFGINAQNSNGQLQVVANNIFGNQNNPQVNCNNQGIADHNYWGPAVLPTDATTKCSVDNDKRLGAPVLHNASTPGLSAELVSVSSSAETYAFNKQIGFQSSDNNTQLYIINHGAGDPQNVPFSTTPNKLAICGNYWDIFLNGPVPTSLNLFFNYNQNSVCPNIIETTKYCAKDGKSPAVSPLLWFNPSSKSWNRSDESITTCNFPKNTSTHEIQITLGKTGSPGLSDLAYLPFAVGLLAPNATTLNLYSYTANYYSNRVELNWTTGNENNIYGYYWQRSQSEDGPFIRLDDSWTPAQLSNNTYTYPTYKDYQIAVGTDYYYRLEIIQADTYRGLVASSYIPPIFLSGLVTTSTITPTPTNSPTPTRTSTLSPTPYKSPTSYTYTYPTYIYRSPTRNYTIYPLTISSTPFLTPTPNDTDIANGTAESAYIAPGVEETPEAPSSSEIPEGSSTEVYQITMASTGDALTATNVAGETTQFPTLQATNAAPQSSQDFSLFSWDGLKRMVNWLIILSGSIVGISFLSLGGLWIRNKFKKHH